MFGRIKYGSAETFFKYHQLSILENKGFYKITILLQTMTSSLGKIFWTIQKHLINIRRFAFYNSTFFEILFIFLYAIEQIFLIYFTFKSKDIKDLGFIVSVFAVIVLTTFALHKLLMVSRIKILESEVKKLQLKKFSLETIIKIIKEEYSNIFSESLSQHLNISKRINRKR